MQLGNSRDNRSAVAAIFFIDVLDNFLAAFMLKVHINIRWFIAGIRHKAGEKKLEFGGIYRGDAQKIANNRVSSRTTSLAKNISTSGKTHKVMNSQEIAGQVLFLHKCQFRINLILYLPGNVAIKSFPCSFQSQNSQFFHWRTPLAG